MGKHIMGRNIFGTSIIHVGLMFQWQTPEQCWCQVLEFLIFIGISVLIDTFGAMVVFPFLFSLCDVARSPKFWELLFPPFLGIVVCLCVVRPFLFPIVRGDRPSMLWYACILLKFVSDYK